MSESVQGVAQALEADRLKKTQGGHTIHLQALEQRSRSVIEESLQRLEFLLDDSSLMTILSDDNGTQESFWWLLGRTI